MSKAFVKDAGPADEDEEESGSPRGSPFPVGTRNYMTPAGHARLQAEFIHLLKVERPEVVSVVSWAASNGDRSENGDYIYGKKRLREIDRRLRFLTKRLDNAVVVDPSAQENTDCVYFGASVSVMDQNGDEFTYSIVGLDEADPGRGRISWVSPLACALIKARLGDCVRFQSPGGLREMEIVAIDYRPLD